MSWILVLMMVREGAALDGYSHRQLAYLAARKPWTVVQDDGAVSDVEIRVSGIRFGHRLEFTTTKAIDENDKNPVVLKENIYAIPHEGQVYWLREHEMTEFTSLSKNVMQETMSIVILLIILILFLSTLRRRTH